MNRKNLIVGALLTLAFAFGLIVYSGTHSASHTQAPLHKRPTQAHNACPSDGGFGHTQAQINACIEQSEGAMRYESRREEEREAAEADSQDAYEATEQEGE